MEDERPESKARDVRTRSFYVQHHHVPTTSKPTVHEAAGIPKDPSLRNASITSYISHQYQGQLREIPEGISGMRAAFAGARTSLSPRSTPPRQTTGLPRTRSSPGRLNSTQASSEIDSAASYLAPTFQLPSKTASTSNAKPAATDTKAVGTRSDFGKPASAGRSKSSIYGKAFELLDDGTLVESLIEPFGSLSLSGNTVFQSSLKGKEKETDQAAAVSEREPTTSKIKAHTEPKPQRAASTPALASAVDPKPIHPFFSRTQSAPASQIRKTSVQSDETAMPKVPAQRKVSVTSPAQKAPVARRSSKDLNNASASNGSTGSGTQAKRRSSSKSSSNAAATPPEALEDTNSVISEAQPVEEPSSKPTSGRGGRAKTSRPKKVIADPNLPVYTYKDPEFAMAYARVEPSNDGTEGPKKKPIEPARWYITNPEEANDALAGLKGPVGFDMEWVVIFRRNVIPRKTALIQIADRTKIMLFHVSRMSEFPSKLLEVIENPDIIKTGVNISGDARKLFKDWGVQAQGIVELAMLAWEVDRQTMQSHGLRSGWTTLANMVSMYLGRVLPKGAERTSNWEQPLDELQMEYAANDAHCGLAIYKKLQAKADAAGIDMSTLRLNRLEDEQAPPTEPTDAAQDDSRKEAEDAYADLVLASADAESQSATASSSGQETKPTAPPCPSKVEYFRYRAYKIWYERPELSLDEMCICLRSAEQPLARKTVIGYVVKTLEQDDEKALPFSKDRLIKLVREEPDSWQWNYKWIVGLESA